MSNEAIKPRYRNGYPTKKFLNQIIEEFDPKMWRLSPCQLYSKCDDFKYLNWSCKYVQERLCQFIDWATEKYGIEFGELKDYKSPCVGHLYIKKKTS